MGPWRYHGTIIAFHITHDRLRGAGSSPPSCRVMKHTAGSIADRPSGSCVFIASGYPPYASAWRACAKIWLMIAQALFTPAQQKLLALLFVRVNEGFHLNEIMRLTGLGSASAQRELRRLHTAGLITSERIGNVRRFWPNKDSLVYPELSGLVQKTFGLVSVLNSSLKPLSKHIRVAFVYGATARDREAATGNIDLLLICDESNYGDVLSSLAPAERVLRRKITPNMYAVVDFKRRLREQQSFLMHVLAQPKIYVVGEEDDLKEIENLDSNPVLDVTLSSR